LGSSAAIATPAPSSSQMVSASSNTAAPAPAQPANSTVAERAMAVSATPKATPIPTSVKTSGISSPEPVPLAAPVMQRAPRQGLFSSSNGGSHILGPLAACLGLSGGTPHIPGLIRPKHRGRKPFRELTQVVLVQRLTHVSAEAVAARQARHAAARLKAASAAAAAAATAASVAAVAAATASGAAPAAGSPSAALEGAGHRLQLSGSAGVASKDSAASANASMAAPANHSSHEHVPIGLDILGPHPSAMPGAGDATLNGQQRPARSRSVSIDSTPSEAGTVASVATTSKPAAGPPPAEAIWTMRFSPDGRYLATAGGCGEDDTRGGVVRVWRVKPWASSAAAAAAAAQSSNNAAASKGPFTHGMPFLDPKPLREYCGHESYVFHTTQYRTPRNGGVHCRHVVDVAWSANASGLLLSASMDRFVRLWHVTRADCLHKFQHPDCVTSVSEDYTLETHGELNTIGHCRLLFTLARIIFSPPVVLTASCACGRWNLAASYFGNKQVL
jgi:hypothetical protein